MSNAFRLECAALAQTHILTCVSLSPQLQTPAAPGHTKALCRSILGVTDTMPLQTMPILAPTTTHTDTQTHRHTHTHTHTHTCQHTQREHDGIARRQETQHSISVRHSTIHSRAPPGGLGRTHTCHLRPSWNPDRLSRSHIVKCDFDFSLHFKDLFCGRQQALQVFTHRSTHDSIDTAHRTHEI